MLKQRFARLAVHVPTIKKVLGLNSRADRYWELDLTRGIAIICMVAFHLSYDLQLFGVITSNNLFAIIVRYIAELRAIFIFIVGVSLSLSYRRAKAKQIPESEIFKGLLLRGVVIFAFGMGITAVVAIVNAIGFARIDPIDFGILHMIGFAIIACYPFLRYRWRTTPWPFHEYRTINLLIGVAIILVGYFYVTQQTVSFPWLLWLGFQPANYVPSDYFPIFPWFGWALVGITVGYAMYRPPSGRRFPLPPISGWLPVRWGMYIGRNALFIYLIHQPILFPLVWAISLFV